MLTCQNGRRVASAPLAVEPKAEPAPLATAPVQAQDATVTARVPKDGSVEEDVGGVAVGGLLPRLGDEVLVLPEGLEDLRIEADVARCDEAFQFLFADHRLFAVFQHRFEADLRQVHFGELEGTLVLFHDGPAFADEGDGVESRGVVDGNDLRFADDDTPTVLQEGSELRTCITGVVDDLLQDGAVDGVPVRIVHQDGDCVENLTL